MYVNVNYENMVDLRLLDLLKAVYTWHTSILCINGLLKRTVRNKALPP